MTQVRGKLQKNLTAESDAPQALLKDSQTRQGGSRGVLVKQGPWMSPAEPQLSFLREL